MADHNYSKDLNTNVSSNGSPADVVPQAPVNLTSEIDNSQHQLMNFQESTPSPTVAFSGTTDDTFCFDSTGMDSLEDFLARPVLIHDLQWTEGTPFTLSNHKIWEEFLDHPVIQRKIDNYAFASFNLHMKFVINASPFYYGALMITYKPLPAFVAASSNTTFTCVSQRPHVWVLPQSNQGAELVLPFFYHKNWLDITSRFDVQQMGEIDIFEVVPLKNANGVTGDSVNLQVYAWAENVKLTGATSKLALQSGKNKSSTVVKDEYGQGPVSRIASAVASSARSLIPVPYISPFAKATEIGASAVSKIASLFGFTNVPVISDVQPFKDVPFHAFASANIGTPIEKLTIDPKNELSIDPRTVGLTGGDELSINYICSKESLFATTVWTSAQASDTLLFGAPVSPVQYSYTNVTNGKRFEMTPMCMISQNFTFWRGDIIFRIKVICTQYHKGRLRVTWDPVYNIAADADTQTSSFTRIVDLSPDLDFEVRCNYLQARHWLSCGILENLSDATSYSTPATGGVAHYPPGIFNNGNLNIRILNELTSPVATSDVTILVFARGADNLEFSYPRVSESNRWSHFVPQAGSWIRSDMEINSQDSNRGFPPNEAVVYQGETVRSMRTLLRRTVFELVSTCVDVNSATAEFQVIDYNLCKFPRPPGWDPSAPTEATNSVPAVVPYSYSKWSTYHWVVPCFVGMRGSINRYYNINTTGGHLDTNVDHVLISDQSATVPNAAGRIVEFAAYDVATISKNDSAKAGRTLTCGGTGQALFNKMTQTGVATVHPHYYPYRFCATDPVYQTVGYGGDDTLYHHTLMQLTLHRNSSGNTSRDITIERYYSVGTDFTTFFFLQVPVVYLYNGEPS